MLSASALLATAYSSGSSTALASATETWRLARGLFNWGAVEVAMGDTLLVPAQLEEHHVHALLDSGSATSIISATAAGRLGLESSEQRSVGGMGGRAEVAIVRDVNITVAGDRRRLPVVIIADLGPVSSAFGRTIDLVIGADMLVGRSMALDFFTRRIGFAPTGHFAGGMGWSSVPLALGAKGELLIAASIGSSGPAPMIFDLGSANALMLSARYVADQRLIIGKPRSTAALAGLEGVQIATAFMADRFSVGGLKVGAVPVLSLNEWLPRGALGNIGLPLIAQFDIVLDISAGWLWLRPAAGYRSLPMLKDRSGLGLSISASALTVVHVAVSSPAEAGGWAVGDRIIRIDGQAVNARYTRGGLWRWRFGPAGTRIALTSDAKIQRELTLADYY